MADSQSSITITRTDESPDLALRSFLPIITRFASAAGIGVDTKDVSLKGRILATFSDALPEGQGQTNDMAVLGDMVKKPEGNIIKLPNISATDAQLIEAVKELQGKGYGLPDYPAKPSNDAETAIKEKYDGLTGSVVNPVLRQGNALRYIPKAVKEQSQRNPHDMGTWTQDSKTSVKHMDGDDFFATEQSSLITTASKGKAKIVFEDENGNQQILKEDIALRESDIIDAAVMRREALTEFLGEAVSEAKEQDVLLSLHLKATMMKKTDGVIYGDTVKAYFEPVFKKHAETFKKLDIAPNSGMSDVHEKIADLPKAQRDEITADIEAVIDNSADLAMFSVDGQNFNNLEKPTLAIMDVSMANLARWGGKLPNKDGNEQDTMAVIPDSTYARMHQAGVEYFQENGALDPKTMGTTTTVRLQAGGAEEYGSKDKTFEAPSKGTIKILAEDGSTLHTHDVEKDDIWRMCRTHDDGIKNWVMLGVQQAKKTNQPALFWFDENRPHDAQIIEKINTYLKDHDTQGLDIQIMSPEKAILHTLKRTAKGENTIAVTGNVIGDHVTDYFPILEVAASSKMLSLVQLLNGGLVAETGSGGTAPGLITGEGIIKGVANDNHFVWDDLGEAFALAESLRHTKNPKAIILGNALDTATEIYLQESNGPSLKGLDTRESQAHLARHWAKALSDQHEDAALQSFGEKLKSDLAENWTDIMAELESQKAKSVDLGGHYEPDNAKADAIMRSSSTLANVLG